MSPAPVENADYCLQATPIRSAPVRSRTGQSTFGRNPFHTLQFLFLLFNAGKAESSGGRFAVPE